MERTVFCKPSKGGGGQHGHIAKELFHQQIQRVHPIIMEVKGYPPQCHRPPKKGCGYINPLIRPYFLGGGGGIGGSTLTLSMTLSIDPSVPGHLSLTWNRFA